MKRVSHNHGTEEGEGLSCRQHPTGDCIIQAYEGRIARLSHTVDKLAGWSGNDISELIEEGFLEEGDLV